MKALIVHNSDEVKSVFIGETNEEIISKLKADPGISNMWGTFTAWSDIVDRTVVDTEVDSDSLDDGVITSEDQITMEHITDLYHDGDSEDGYTLLETN